MALNEYITLTIKDEELYLKLKKKVALERGLTLIDVTEDLLKKGFEWEKKNNDN
jgi:hypothetical protein